MKKIKVNKVEAARRQVNTAIMLLFENGDSVAVHTLAHAANTILADLCRKFKTEPSLVQDIESRIKPERMKEWRYHEKKHANFFKHADKDPHAISEEFDARSNDFVLYFAYSRYTHLGNQETDEMTAFRLWFMIVYKDLFLSEVQEIAQKILASHSSLSSEMKTDRDKDIYIGKNILKHIGFLKERINNPVEI